MGWTAADLRKLGQTPPEGATSHKYGAKAVVLCRGCSSWWHANAGVDVGCSCGSDRWIRFDSKREFNRFRELVMLQDAGQIRDLLLQPKFPFPMGFKYVADFSYSENGKPVVEDVKGVETAVFRLKRKCFMYFYPNLELRVTK